ncbi:MAG: DNA translocase FtsK 4TM domain-containing protein, partial [Anaerolineales bacterium]|nr:DNA translocase FtsK 4TM domain-containing protein [Anaerolineales bacterium]
MTRKASTRAPKSEPVPPPTWDERFINSLIPWRVEIAGGALCLFALITLLALPGLTEAAWSGWWTSLLRQVFGWGAYPLFFILAAVGLHLAIRKVKRPYHFQASQVVGLELLLITALPLSHLLTNSNLSDAYRGLGGGLVGWALSEPLLELIGPLLTSIVYAVLLLWGFALLVNYTWLDMLETLNRLTIALRQWAEKIAPPEPEIVAPAVEAETAVPLPQSRLTTPPDLIIIDDSAPQDEGIDWQHRDKRLPPLTLLEEGSAAAMSPAEIDEKKRIIEETLADFQIPATVTEIRRGPAITQFGVEPGYVEKVGPEGDLKQQKIRIGQIASLRRDLALALAVTRLRIEAPVPGRGVVGVEVPNAEISLVRLRSVLEADAFAKIKSPLGVALGQDVSGVPLAVDLATLPHLLIAGTTGSGKSVCINAFVSCLVFNNPPDKLNLIMIDPKKVELIRFNGLP